MKLIKKNLFLSYTTCFVNLFPISTVDQASYKVYNFTNLYLI